MSEAVARTLRRWAVLGASLVLLAAGCSQGGTGRDRADGQGRTGGTGSSAQARTLAFSDDFGGGTLDTSRWNTCHWWGHGGCTIGDSEMEWYLPGQVRQQDGRLDLVAQRQDVVGSDGRKFPYVSGMVSTGPPTDEGTPSKFSFTYGTVEIRFRVPRGTGLWPALWMLPANRHSRPEIDLLEVIGQKPGDALFHLHPKDRSQPVDGHASPAASDMSAGWHVVRLRWEPGVLHWWLDGARKWTVTGDRVPDQPMYLVMNLAVGGDYPGPPTSETRFPASFLVDYVRIWTGGVSR